MAKVQFKSYTQGQMVLFPSRLDERIPENSPVRLISHIVDGLDLTQLLSTCESVDTTPCHPRMLLKVVFYACMNNIYSCRKIASMLEHHIHYMWLSGNQRPSFSTINRFRSEHIKDCINHLFVQAVQVPVEMGQVSLDVQYVDGTKIESVANKYTFVWRKSTESNKKKLEAKIRNILSQIDEGIAQDKIVEAEPADSPIDSVALGKLIDKINHENNKQSADTKKEKTEVQEKKKQIKELEKHREKLQEYEQKLDILGDRNSFSKTDHDGTFMRMKEDAMNNGQTKPGYNLQSNSSVKYVLSVGDKTYFTELLLFEKVQMDFGIFAMAFNLKKLCANLANTALLSFIQRIKGLLCCFRVKKNPLKQTLKVDGFLALNIAA